MKIAGSVLTNLKFKKSILNNTYIGNSDLTGVSFYDCDITESFFYNSVLVKAKMSNCDLSNTYFDVVRMNKSSLLSCNLTRVSFINSSLVNLSLLDSFSKKMELTSCNLDGSMIRGKFPETLFLNTTFRSAWITSSKFNSCKFSGCNMVGIRAELSSFVGSNFRGVNLVAATFDNCNLNASYFGGTTMIASKIKDTELKATMIDARCLKGMTIERNVNGLILIHNDTIDFKRVNFLENSKTLRIKQEILSLIDTKSILTIYHQKYCNDNLEILTDSLRKQLINIPSFDIQGNLLTLRGEKYDPLKNYETRVNEAKLIVSETDKHLSSKVVFINQVTDIFKRNFFGAISIPSLKNQKRRVSLTNNGKDSDNLKEPFYATAMMLEMSRLHNNKELFEELLNHLAHNHPLFLIRFILTIDSYWLLSDKSKLAVNTYLSDKFAQKGNKN